MFLRPWLFSALLLQFNRADLTRMAPLLSQLIPLGTADQPERAA
jgi:hypothetical protein